MRPAWQLAIKNASARKGRTSLLVGAVAFSAALITAVASGLHSLNKSVELRSQATLGVADAKIQPRGYGETLDESLLEQVRGWMGVTHAVPTLERPLPRLGIETTVYDLGGSQPAPKQTFVWTSEPTTGSGVDFLLEPMVRPVPLLAGRLPDAPDEVLVNTILARQLSYEPSEEDGIFAGFGYDSVSPKFVERREALPEPRAGVSEREAKRFNRFQGLRTGDELIVSKSLVAGGPIRAAAWQTLEALAGSPNVGIFEGVLKVTVLGGRAAEQVLVARDMETAPKLKVVGVVDQPPLGGRPRVYLPLQALQDLTDNAGKLSSIDIIVREDLDPEVLVEAWRKELVGEAPEDSEGRPQTQGAEEPSRGIGALGAQFAAARNLGGSEDKDEPPIIQTTAKITSDLDKNLKSSQLGFILASVLASLSGAFIVLTGLNTDLAERMRELAIVRSVGGSRSQLAEAQIVTGAIIGFIGAFFGIPLGLLGAWGVTEMFPQQLPSGLIVPWDSVALAAIGALMSGVLGGVFPAYRAATMPPVRALRPQAASASARGIGLIAAAGALGVIAHLLLVIAPVDREVMFWTYAFAGLPVMFIGWFLLSVPLAIVTARIASPLIARLLGIPRGVLSRTIAGSPYRYGFTAGAMMTGLALMVSIWSNGGSLLRDWIGKMEFPDAFVSGIDLAPGAQQALDQMPFVDNTCAITLELVDSDLEFGVPGLQKYKTTLIGFQPDRFFNMTQLQWEEGSLEEAFPKLEEGGAVLVAREFKVAFDLSIGDRFAAYDRDGGEHEFEIVGVVSSPGLDIASRFFNIGDTYAHQSVHAVFANVSDLRTKFGSDATHMIQVDLSEDSDDAEVIPIMKSSMIQFGGLDVGSGRQIKAGIQKFANGTLAVFSVISIAAMMVACFGVANLIVAAVHARRFEFGVIRSVGGARSTIVRMVLGEALIIGILAALVGAAMGMQSSLGGRRIYELLLGIQFSVRPAWGPILWGSLTVICLTLLASAPAVIRLNQRTPRDLIASSD